MINITFLVNIMDRLNEVIGFLYNFQLFEKATPEIRQAVVDRGDINHTSAIIRERLLRRPINDEDRSKLLSLYLNTLTTVGNIISSNLYGPKNINSYIFNLSQLIQNAPDYGYSQDQIETLERDHDLEVTTKKLLTDLDRDYNAQIQVLLNIEKTNSELSF
ncbi:hypothetical protein [Leptospira stimsonii]|uniref:Uncharacterized protein n=1 Tax=Leptospira stimsonii TaxID=2202203 RepID=A0A396Z0S5_9LEPT|nr:hypothetical protein [Leptospira stimsonii]RHX89042.1 hypothetical protein DLM75_14340 [Leptospira stimsonii]